MEKCWLMSVGHGRVSKVKKDHDWMQRLRDNVCESVHRRLIPQMEMYLCQRDLLVTILAKRSEEASPAVGV